MRSVRAAHLNKNRQEIKRHACRWVNKQLCMLNVQVGCVQLQDHISQRRMNAKKLLVLLDGRTQQRSFYQLPPLAQVVCCILIVFSCSIRGLNPRNPVIIIVQESVSANSAAFQVPTRIKHQRQRAKLVQQVRTVIKMDDRLANFVQQVPTTIKTGNHLANSVQQVPTIQEA